MKRLFIILSLLGILALLIACQIPILTATSTPAPSTSVPAATVPIDTFATQTAQVPMATPTETAVPTTPIAHLPTGTQLTITDIHMVTISNGWGAGTAPSDQTVHILHTTDGGNTWMDVTPPEGVVPDFSQVPATFFMDDAKAWVAYSQPTDSGNPLSGSAHVWYTQDSGATWTSSQALPVDGTADFFSPGEFAFSDDQHGWLMVHVGVGMMHDYVYVFATTDGGATWSKVVDPTNSTLWMSCNKTGMAFTDANNGWATGDCHGVAPGLFLYHTTDGGNTWAQATISAPAGKPNMFTDQNSGCGSYDMTFQDANKGDMLVTCVSFNNNVTTYLSWIYTTTDGGQNWTSHALPSASGQYQFLDVSHGYYVAGHIYKTIDGGASWSLIIPVSWDGQPDFVDLNNGWIVARNGTDIALVKTTNAAVNWAIIKAVIAP
ncbi:MAG TPA: hypothetical protein VMC62_02050 [Longilinea sp.]|nr:hypothetical protein [Longilinea sp.]